MSGDAREKMNWMPIDSAPKDGSYVIVWPPTRRGAISCARFDNDSYSKNPRPYWNRLDARISASRDNPPTHWMPVFDGPDI